MLRHIFSAKCGMVTHLKLRSLSIILQAWSLVWMTSRCLMRRYRHWANGPVVPRLYERLRQRFGVDQTILGCGNQDRLSTKSKETIDAVLKFYGKRTSQYLSDLTHMEDP